MAAVPFRWIVALGAVTVLGACGESPLVVAGGDAGRPISVMLAALAPDPGTTFDGVTVTVSGPGIPNDLVFDLGVPVSTGEALKSFDIPAGPARVFVARAFSGGVLTHESDATTADVTRTGLSIDLTLRKLLGAGGINATVEDFDVAVDDADPFLAPAASTTAGKGETVPFSVKVTYSFGNRNGDPVAGVAVAWGSENPGIVQAGSGACTTGADGTCSITATVPQSAKKGETAGVVASYAGIAHRVDLSVE